MYVCMYKCMNICWRLSMTTLYHSRHTKPGECAFTGCPCFQQNWRYIPWAVPKDCSTMVLVIDIIWSDTWYEYYLVRGKLSKTGSGSGYQLCHSGLSLDINHGYRESGVRVAQACITIIQCCTDVFKFSICYFPSNSCCKRSGDVCRSNKLKAHSHNSTHRQQKSYHNAIWSPHLNAIWSPEDLGGDLSDWAALFRESTAHPVNWEELL